jgi:hypothetical protein
MYCRNRRGNCCRICRLLDGPEACGGQADPSFASKQEGLEGRIDWGRRIDANLEIIVQA